MGASGIRAGRAFIELFADDGPLDRGLQQAQRKLAAWGAGITSMGLKVAAAGGAGIAAGLGFATSFAKAGDGLLRLSERTGDSVERLSEMAYVAQTVGGNLGTVEQALGGVDGLLFQVAEGSNSAAETLGRLNLSFASLRNMTSTDRLRAVADALSRIDGAQVRAEYGARALGSAYQTLAPALRDGAAGLDRIAAQGRAGGAIMSREDAERAQRFSIALNTLWASLQRIGIIVGAAVTPVIEAFVQWIGNGVTAVTQWLDQHRELSSAIMTGLGALFAFGVALVAVGAALSVASYAVGLMSWIVGVGYFVAIAAATAVTWLYNLGLFAINASTWLYNAAIAIATGSTAVFSVGMLVAKLVMWAFGIATTVATAGINLLIVGLGLIIAILAGVGLYLVATSGAFSDFSSHFASFGKTITQALGGISDAIAMGDWKSAMAIAWVGIKMVWAMGIGWLKGAWLKFIDFFPSSFDQLGLLFSTALETIVVGWKTAWNYIGTFIESLWVRIGFGIERFWSGILTFIQTNFARLVDLLPAAVRDLIQPLLGDFGSEANANRAAGRREDDIRGRELNEFGGREIGMRRNRQTGRMEMEREPGRLENDRAIRQAEIVDVSNRAIQRATDAVNDAWFLRGAERAANREATTDAELDRLQRELDALTEEVEANRIGMELQEALDMSRRPGARADDLDGVMRRASQGTFSASQAAAFGDPAQTIARRQLDATIDVHDAIREMLDAIRSNVLVWTRD